MTLLELIATFNHIPGNTFLRRCFQFCWSLPSDCLAACASLPTKFLRRSNAFVSASFGKTFNHIPGNTYNAVLESAITLDDSSEN
jgi:hypothetical protein